MKTKSLVIGSAVLIVMLISCKTTYSPVIRPLSEEPNAEVLGYIDWIYIGNSQKEYRDHIAYIRLLEEAKRRYTGDVDVREISWKFEDDGSNTYIKGTVIRVNADGKIGAALEKASEQIMALLQPSSKIAIVYISSSDQNIIEFIASELEFRMVKERFIIIDRIQLDKIRQEQNFQLSGEVDDETAVSIGKLVGADIIITGSITGTGGLKRLRLRALNAQTAQVMAVASEQL